MAVIAGKVAPRFMGAYNSSTTYQFYDAVTYGNKLYFCKTSGTVGKTPSGATDNYWFLSIDGTFTDASSLGGETATQWQGKIDKKVNIASAPLIKGTAQYTIFAKIKKTISEDYPRAVLLLSNFNDTVVYGGLFAVSVSYYRRQIAMSARALSGNATYSPVTFGYYSDDTYVYFGVRASNYGDARKIVDLGHTDNFEVGMLSTLTAEPSGWTTIDISRNTTDSDLANYLPLTGGTISGAYPLNINDNTNTNEAYVTFSASDTRLGFIGVNKDSGPIFMNTNWAQHKLLHTGNKPTGSYTGNGDATQRDIYNDGIGRAIIIRNAYWSTIATNGGAFAWNGQNGTTKIFNNTEVYYNNGTLRLKTAHEAVNSSGSTIGYECL